jgi:CRP-like cAMP-binding protein
MMKKLKIMIDQNQILSLFDASEKLELQSSAIRRDYRKGEFIANYGEPWPYLCLVGSGEIDVLKFSPEGRNLGALALAQGELFWSPSFFDEGPLPAALEAKADCRIYLWKRDAVIPLLRKNNESLWAWTMMLVERIRIASGFIEELAFHPLASRVARLLLDQFDELDVNRVARELTLDEMSTKINTSPVMVCKLLYRFAADGLIKVNRTSFELLDRAELEKVCGPRT